MNAMKKAIIVAKGNVQGVGFRYFIQRNAANLELNGYVKNLFSGNEVLIEVEGNENTILQLYELTKTGPQFSVITECTINWFPFTNEFKIFDVRF